MIIILQHKYKKKTINKKLHKLTIINYKLKCNK